MARPMPRFAPETMMTRPSGASICRRLSPGLVIQGHAPHFDAPAVRRVWRRSKILECTVEAKGAGRANVRVGIWLSALRAGQPAGRVPLLYQERFIPGQ